MKTTIIAVNKRMKTIVTATVAFLLVLSSAFAESVVGVGLALYRANDYGPVKVKQVFSGSPASKAGIKPGFNIISIDGTNTTDKSLRECAELIRGVQGSQVILGVVDPDQNTTNNITLKRASIQYHDSSQQE